MPVVQKRSRAAADHTKDNGRNGMNSLAPTPAIRRPHEALAAFAAELFTAAGLDADKSTCVARLLLLTDMMGRHTHGVAQCAPYLAQVAGGTMTRTGSPETIRDTGSTIV